MNPSFFIIPLKTLRLLLLLSLAGLPSAWAQHGHLNAGAFDSNTSGSIDNGDQLYFINGSSFVAGSGFVKELELQSGGSFDGLYTGGITLTSVAGSDAASTFVWSSFFDAYLPADPNGALQGSNIYAEILSVSGPSGGVFGLSQGNVVPVPLWSWDVDTDSLAAGNAQWNLTDPNQPIGDGVVPGGTGANGTPPQDPFGHIHGRTFTATEAGQYTVTMKLTDLSGNHTDSDPFQLQFNAIPEPTAIAALASGLLGLVWWRRRSTTKQG